MGSPKAIVKTVSGEREEESSDTAHQLKRLKARSVMCMRCVRPLTIITYSLSNLSCFIEMRTEIFSRSAYE